jgi:hydroxyethylthiazole kinase-like uncharacterized protein yjeF
MKPILLNAAAVRRAIPHRPVNSQKGKNGHVLIVAGSRNMPGAAILACLGALKVGAGLVTLASAENVRAAAVRKLPEVMTIKPSDTRSYVRRRTITTLAVGPGLGVGAAQKRMVLGLIGMNFPMVLDADGLNNASPNDLKGRPMMITPHPGELAKLLGMTIKGIQAHRAEIAEKTAKRLEIVCVLKGHRTVVSDGQRTCLNTTGNSAMATGGMGDVLTGIIAGLLAQGLSLYEAAYAGVYLHGLAGDLAAVSDRGLLATELAAHIPHALRKIGFK